MRVKGKDISAISYKGRSIGEVRCRSKLIWPDAVEPFLSIAPTSYQASSGYQTFTITITSNIEWVMTIENDWMFIDNSIDDGNNGARIIGIEANDNSNIRVGNIRFEGGGIIRYCGVNQQGSVSDVDPPVITSGELDSLFDRTQDSVDYTITATNNPTSYGASGLPSGVSINTNTGLISGIPTAEVGEYSVTITATNEGGTGTKQIIIRVVEDLGHVGLYYSTDRNLICETGSARQVVKNGATINSSTVFYEDFEGNYAPAGYYRQGSTVYFWDGGSTKILEGTCPI